MPEELFITDVRGEMFGMPDHALVADGLSVTWYKDASYTQPYGFDEALSAVVYKRQILMLGYSLEKASKAR